MARNISIPLICAVSYEDGERFHSFIKDFKTRIDVFERYADLLCEKTVSDKGFFESFDFFVYMPSLSPDRINYSLKLAEYVSEKLNKPLRCGVLEKIKPTKEIKMLPKEERAEEIANSFRAKLSGNEKICIIDDVCASGATLNEASRTLKSAGASFVCSAVAAVYLIA
ncbi:MAG: hypothetical protein LBR69_06620 [Endomicrobium sp.]|jgi:predicted amidophosphoribosyltransferase|nr:hypothetical protein [Endomicrobium sp.]